MNVIVEGVRKSAVKQVTDADTTVYEVTSGRTFYASAIIVAGISGAVVSIYDGPSSGGVQPILPIPLEDKGPVIINRRVLNDTPEFLSSVVAKSTISGVWVQIIGVER